MAADRTYKLTLCEEALLDLLRGGLWASYELNESLYRDIDWADLYNQIRQQSLLALCWDGMLKLTPSCQPPRPLKFKWYAAVRSIEDANKRFNSLSAELCQFLQSHDVDVVLLKGQAISTLYPNSIHRQCGDIDLYVGDEDYAKSHELLTTHYNLVYEGFSTLHQNYIIKGIPVEVHRKMLHLHSRQRERNFAEELKTWYPNSIGVVLIDGKELPVPAQKFNEAYILLHLYKHLITYGVGLRQVIDWAYVAGSIKEDENILPEYNDLRELFSNIAVNYLGFPREALPHYNGDKVLSSNILKIIFRDGNMGKNSRHKDRVNNYFIDKLISFKYMTSRWFSIYSLLPGHANSYIVGQICDSVKKLFFKQ